MFIHSQMQVAIFSEYSHRDEKKFSPQ